MENIFEGLGVEINLKKEEDFLKVKETLTRVGVSSKTDKKLYDDPWQKSDINLLNKHFRLIKKLIGAKLIFNKKIKKWSLKYEN